MLYRLAALAYGGDVAFRVFPRARRVPAVAAALVGLVLTVLVAGGIAPSPVHAATR